MEREKCKGDEESRKATEQTRWQLEHPAGLVAQLLWHLQEQALAL
jgi:hypothetical protein